MKKRMGYLCLGSAVAAHVEEIVSGLRRRAWDVAFHGPTCAGSFRERGLARSLLMYVQVQWRLWQAAQQVDVLYIRRHLMALGSILWARWKRIPVVLELNETDEDCLRCFVPPFLWPIGLWLLSLGIRLSDAVVVVTERHRELLRTRGVGGNVYVIPNAANPTVFHPADSREREARGPYVAWFGFMALWQGIETMLQAVETPEWPSDVRLVMVGHGPLSGDVRRAAASGKRVDFVETQQQSSIAALIASSIASLSPQDDYCGRSSTIGLAPLKVYESLACGVPVIVTDFPGQADLVKAANSGVVIRPRDPLGLARAVAALRNDEAGRRQMGRNGRQAIVNGHSWEHRVDATERVLQNLLASRGKGKKHFRMWSTETGC